LYETQSDKLNIISRYLTSLKPPKLAVTMNHSQQLEQSLGKRTELICTPNIKPIFFLISRFRRRNILKKIDFFLSKRRIFHEKRDSLHFPYAKEHPIQFIKGSEIHLTSHSANWDIRLSTQNEFHPTSPLVRGIRLSTRRKIWMKNWKRWRDGMKHASYVKFIS